MKAKVSWLEGMTMVAESGSGHAVVIDGPPDLGGKNLGPRPMEMLLLGLGGCASIDVISMLRKSRQAITDCVVEIDSERAETEPKVFTKITMHFVVTGKSVESTKVERAVNLSAEKYCSASIMLGEMAEISHSFEVVEA